jgi:hypothetical protein
MKKKEDTYPPIPVCDGGFLSGGSTTITFTNSSTTTAYTINTPTSVPGGQNMQGWPVNQPQTVPQAQNGVNGGKTVTLTVAAQSGKTYQYTTTPVCPQQANPKIVVQ